MLLHHFSGCQLGVGGEQSDASNINPCMTAVLHCHAQMLWQPLLQPGSVKGRGGIHRCLHGEDQCLPRTTASLLSLSLETMADLQSMGVFSSSKGQPPHGCSKL